MVRWGNAKNAFDPLVSEATMVNSDSSGPDADGEDDEDEISSAL